MNIRMSREEIAAVIAALDYIGVCAPEVVMRNLSMSQAAELYERLKSAKELSERWCSMTPFEVLP